MKLSDLLPSWDGELEYQNRSPRTRRAYAAGVAAFERWLVDNGRSAELGK